MNLWPLYLMSTKTAKRPSEIVGIDEEWVAYQFDNAVILACSAIENAAQEMHQVGSGKNKEWKQKYTMQQLLDPNFRLPPSERPSRRERETDDTKFFSGLSGFSVEEIA